MNNKFVFDEEIELLESIGGAGGAPIPLGFSWEMPCLLMTFCGKDDLASYAKRASEFSLLHVLTLALRVTDRLRELHQAGFVHCDLKSNNVTLKLDAEENVKSVHIIDFGLSLRMGKMQKLNRPTQPKRWYCECVFESSPVSGKCDLPGLSTIFTTLFGKRDDIPHHLLDLAKRCASPSHAERPDLEHVRECFVKAIALLHQSRIGSEEQEHAT